MKKTPVKIIYYLTKEFLYTFLLIFLVFLSISILINFVEEMSFFKEKKIENLILMVTFLSLIKTPNTLIDLSIFIFLFSGIFFFIKIRKNNEINTILLSGVNKILPILVPGVNSFFMGILIIFLISPLSSALIKIYEATKRVHMSNENLIVINNNGLWFMENLPQGYNIIRADRILDNNFTNLTNVTIYSLDKNFNFTKRLDGKSVKIDNKNWILDNARIFSSSDSANQQNKKNHSNVEFISTINIADLKSYFSNSDTVSFVEISSFIKNLNNRGYSADELKVKFHKYMSLPLYIFGMILISTIFTINAKKEYNISMNILFGLGLSFLIFFLNDLSVALGLSNKLPIQFAVWSPVIIINLINIIILMKTNDAKKNI